MVSAKHPRLPLFVYGTLLPGESNYPSYLAGRTRHEQPATVSGTLWLVEAEDYPYLLPGPGIVQGMLAELLPELYTKTLAAVDRLEDYAPLAPETSLYRRQIAEVRLSDGGITPAWCYVWNAATSSGRRLFHGDFRRRREPGGTKESLLDCGQGGSRSMKSPADA